jgi:hypothetical protein
MNTAQLTVLWYAGLLIAGILVFQISDTYASIAVVILLASLLIYTVKPHPHARKGWLLLFIVGPLIVIGVGVYGWKEYEAYQERIAAGLILPEQIAITDLNLQRSSEELFPSLYLTGTIQNRSSYVLREIILDVTPQYGLLGTTTERIAVHVLPGNSTSFREELPFYPERLLPEKQRIPVDFKVMGARGQLADKR